jgi:PAS domain S-box-containing protein
MLHPGRYAWNPPAEGCIITIPHPGCRYVYTCTDRLTPSAIDMISILLVGNDTAFLEAISLLLKRDPDISVTISPAAPDMPELLRAGEGYDLIVSDDEVAGMDGIEFLKQIRSQGLDVPFILLASRGRERVALEAYTCGADLLLDKGGDPQVLMAELNAVVKRMASCRYPPVTEDGQARLYAYAVDQSMDMIAVIDRHYRYRIANPLYASAHQRSEEQIIGRTVADLMGEDVFEEAIRQKFDQCLERERVHFDAWFTYADGRKFMDVRYYPLLEDGEVKYVGVVIRDISRLKQRKTETENRIARLETLIRVSGDVTRAKGPEELLERAVNAFQSVTHASISAIGYGYQGRSFQFFAASPLPPDALSHLSEEQIQEICLHLFRDQAGQGSTIRLINAEEIFPDLKGSGNSAGEDIPTTLRGIRMDDREGIPAGLAVLFYRGDAGSGEEDEQNLATIAPFLSGRFQAIESCTAQAFSLQGQGIS